MLALRSSLPFFRHLSSLSYVTSRHGNSLRLLNRPFNTYREVQEHEEGDTLVVEGVQKDMPGSSQFVQSHTACPLCSRNIELKYTDVLILEQFVDKKGELLPTKVTGVCSRQHGRLRLCIEMAQKAVTGYSYDRKILFAQPGETLGAIADRLVNSNNLPIGLLPAPDRGDKQPPPEWMRIPQGSFHIFYNKKRKDYRPKRKY